MKLRERRGVARFLTDARFRKQVVDEAHRRGIGKDLGTGEVDVMKWLKILLQILPIILMFL